MPPLRFPSSVPSVSSLLKLRPVGQVSQRARLTTSSRLAARKDTQDKDSLKPESSEYSKSGSDDAAAQEDAAFDPSKTRPEQHHSTEGSDEGPMGNPLDASPANKDISKPRDLNEGGAERSANESNDQRTMSGGGSPQKNGGHKSGGGGGGSA